MIQAKERLIRIMGTFDLATGHGNTMEELLDSLESELRDVLGHYREALKQEQGEPVAWMTINEYGEEDDIHYENPAGHLMEGWTYKPLYTTPQQRKPLTRKDIDRLHEEDCFSGNIYEITAEIEAAHGIKD